MCHSLSGLSTYGLNGHRQGDEHPAYAPEGHGTLYLFLFQFRLGISELLGIVGANRIKALKYTQENFDRRKIERRAENMT